MSRDAVRAVGEELRRLGELLATREVPADVLTRVAEQLGAAAASMEAQPAQPRWYERSELGAADRERSRAGSRRARLRCVGAANRSCRPALRGRPRGPTAGPRWVRATLGPLHEGPPGIVHGGWLAALFDEVLPVGYRRPAEVGGRHRAVSRCGTAGRRGSARSWCSSAGSTRTRPAVLAGD